jgi:hypothetical protein
METVAGCGNCLIFPLKISIGCACLNVLHVYYFQARSLQNDELSSYYNALYAFVQRTLKEVEVISKIQDTIAV